MIHDLTSSFSSELSNKELSLRKAQLQLREVTSELTELRSKIGDMQQSMEDADYFGERVKRLTFIMDQEGARLEKSATGGDKVPFRVEIASIEVARKELQESSQELEKVAAALIKRGSYPPATELLCKKIISQCLSVPFDEVERLLDPLSQAVATDGNADLNLGELNRFMSRVKATQSAATA